MIDCDVFGDEHCVIVQATVLGKRKQMVFQVPFAKFDAALDTYDAGALAQDAFPFLTAEEREFLLSGMLPSEFAALCTEGDYTEE
jgi:hypothetical protein